jgi:hypothetical protein
LNLQQAPMSITITRLADCSQWNRLKITEGRVLLASTKEGRLLVTQLDIPFRSAEHLAENHRIAELDRVQAFLRHQPTGNFCVEANG